VSRITRNAMNYCLIPAKPFHEAKSRLGPILSTEQRVTLSRWLLRRTLRLALGVAGQVVVVSRDRALLIEAKAAGAWGLLEAAPGGLNPALTQAARFARARGASALLVLPTDLPRLTMGDLKTMLALGSTHPSPGPPPRTPKASLRVPGAGRPPALVIAPCRHGTGTNALLMRPSDLMPFAFGPNSFSAHCAAARAAGVEPTIYRSRRVAFDLDTPEDWETEIGNLQLADLIQAW
jgi:2-phospho-L-lactate guanylyltransferase